MKTDAERRAYNRDYYQKNRRSINKRRRERYHTDPVLRLNTQRTARDRHRRLYASPNAHIGYTVKQVDGVQLFTIQYAAQAAGFSTDYLRDLERMKIIPKTTYTDTRGWRLYTAGQIEALGVAFKNMSSGNWSRAMVRDYLIHNWDGGSDGEREARTGQGNPGDY